MTYHLETTVPTPDGAALWCGLEGEGSPALVMCDGLGCEGFAWKYLVPAFSGRHRVVRWHYRGHGRSTVPRDPTRLGIDHCVEDLARVLDAVGLSRAVLLGHSMGVQIAFEFHRRYPARVQGLVPICGSYGHPLDTFHGTDLGRRALPYLAAVVERAPWAARAFARAVMPSDFAFLVARISEVNRHLIRREDLQPYLEHLAVIDPMVFLRTLASASQHSSQSHLPAIDVPTLIVAGDRDTFTPVWLSERMHAAIPGSELLVVRTGSHAAPIEMPELIALRIERFFRDRLGVR